MHLCAINDMSCTVCMYFNHNHKQLWCYAHFKNACISLSENFIRVFSEKEHMYCSDLVRRPLAAATVWSRLVVFWWQSCCQCVSLSRRLLIDSYLLSLWLHDVLYAFVKGFYLAVRLSCSGISNSSPPQYFCHPSEASCCNTFRFIMWKNVRKITAIVD